MHTFLARAGVRLLDFKQYAVSTPSSSNRARCKKRSISSPIPYVPNSKVDKDSPDVMRFLGRKGLHGGFQGELNSRLIRRLEGTRVKHWVQGNSVKMYDKAGNCLRVETTIAKTKAFKVLRPLQGQSRSTVGLAYAAHRHRGPPPPCSSLPTSQP